MKTECCGFSGIVWLLNEEESRFEEDCLRLSVELVVSCDWLSGAVLKQLSEGCLVRQNEMIALDRKWRGNCMVPA